MRYSKNFDKIVVIAVLLIASGCVTQRSQEDYTGFGKFYHNMTSHYNGYFNADELVEDAKASLNAGHRDNYNQILPIYPYVAVDNADGVSADMDLAIEKVVTVAKLHRGADWTDDCYVLMGEAQFLKQDYESAQETLEYFADEFDPDSPKNRAKDKSAKKRAKKAAKGNAKAKKSKKGKKQKRPVSKEEEAEKKEREKAAKERAKLKKKNSKKKKKKKKKKRPGSQKRPERPATKTTTEKKETTDSKESSKEVEPKKEAPEVPKKSKKEKEEEKEKKEDPDYNQDKKGEGFFGHKKAYPAGQLLLARTYIEREKYSYAEYLINKVLREPESYEDIIQQAHVARAHMYIKKSEYSTAIPSLREGIDRAYKRPEKARLAFIMAQLYQKTGNPSQAKIAFDEALSYKPEYDMEFNARLNMLMNEYRSGSGSEMAQKSLNKLLKDEKNAEYKDQIYFSIAQIHLENGRRVEGLEMLELAIAEGGSNSAQLGESHYLLAYLYFEDENYPEAKNNFDGAITHLNKNDDRYPEVNKMSSNLDNIVAQIEIIELQDSLLAVSLLDDKAKRELARKIRDNRKNNTEEKNQKVQNAPIRRVGKSNNTQTSFWAYDEKNIKKHQKDFEKFWGERKLEDNWRRSAKLSYSSEEVVDNSEEENVILVSSADLAEILKDVPTNDQERALADEKILNAMMELGKLYRSKIQNYERSVEILETMLQRYPNSKYTLDAWFYLYLSHLDLGNTSKADKYKLLIIKNHPESEYYEILTDPNYVAKQKLEEMELEEYYHETYMMLDAGYCEEINTRADSAISVFGEDHKYIAKFELLKTFCVGKTDGAKEYVKALQSFVKKYPNTEEEVRAREIIRLLGGRDDIGDGIATEFKDLKFKLNDDKLHYIMLVVYELGKGSIEQVKTDLNAYNEEYHKLDNLRMSSINMDNTAKTPIVLLRRFKTKKEAMKYYDGVQRKKKRFLSGEVEYEIFAITQNNWREVLKLKSVTEYRQFFSENYIEK